MLCDVRLVRWMRFDVLRVIAAFWLRLLVCSGSRLLQTYRCYCLIPTFPPSLTLVGCWLLLLFLVHYCCWYVTLVVVVRFV